MIVIRNIFLTQENVNKLLNLMKHPIINVNPCFTPNRINKRRSKSRIFRNNNDPSFVINTQDKHGVALLIDNIINIKLFTPLECMRLMDFDDGDYYILKDNGISNSQIYKMAGNSIVVGVLENIFIKLLK